MHFRKISTKLAVVFSCLFVTVMLALAIVSHKLASEQARAIVGDGMIASGDVFSRLFDDQGADIRSDAALQVKDFGFRGAVTSGDEPTIASALETLQARLGVDALAFVDRDARPLSAVGASLPLARLPEVISETTIATASQAKPGVVFIDGQPVLAGVVPVKAPDIVGWVIFGEYIEQADMAELEGLAPIELVAALSSSSNVSVGNDELYISGENFLLQHAVDTFFPSDTAHLTFTYPVRTAMAPFRALLTSFITVGIIGSFVVSVASWGVAGWLTRPISALVQGVNQIRVGHAANVSVKGRDELANLAAEFNHMSGEVRNREEEVRRSARTDRETAFPNRLAFEEKLADDTVDPTTHVVMVSGIDRLSSIRNAIGFEATASLQRSVAKIAQAHPLVDYVSCLSSGTLSLLVKAGSVEAARAAAASLKGVLNTTISTDATEIDVMVKIGVAAIPDPSPETALNHATIAQASGVAQNQELVFFDPQMCEDTTNNLSMMGDLVKGMADGSVFMAYQPKFDLRTRQPIGVEALVRWTDKVRGQVFPDAFIPLAEETGHVEPLTYHVLSQAIAAQKELRALGHDLSMSVNVSGRLIGQPKFTERAIALVADAVGQICFEITETAVIADPERGLASILAFADAGIDISIDDYGAGLSSLAYLKQIPARELKIDKEFVLEIDHSHRDALLVRSTIDLAHSLDMKVTAEGIETANAAALLAGMGCDVGQGYALARPMEFAWLVAFLNDQTSEFTGQNQDTNHLAAG